MNLRHVSWQSDVQMYSDITLFLCFKYLDVSVSQRANSAR